MQLAGVVAVEVTGGPEIPFHPGRQVGLFSLSGIFRVFVYIFVSYEFYSSA